MGMVKGIGKLAALKVTKETKPGYYGDGGGLWLQVSKSGTKSWVFRFKSPVTGKAREMGMGSANTYSLAEARSRATDVRKIVDAGLDPIVERDTERQRIKLATVMAMTFEQCANTYIEAHRAMRSKMIHQWKPWDNSTGPRTLEGRRRSAVRGYKGSLRGQLQEIKVVLDEIDAPLESPK